MDTNLETLKEAIEYAKKTGSFNTLNMIEQADNVCIWGAGTFFMEAYERYFLKRNIKVHYVVDSNPEKWGRKIMGVLCISPTQLFSLENAVVIPLLKNGYGEVIEECRKRKIKWIHSFFYFFDLHVGGERGIEWFCKNSKKIEAVYNMLEDDESRRIYANIICNRFANDLSRVEYDQLYSEGEYFNLKGLYKLGNDEGFVDVGAYDGDSVQNFLEAVNYNFKSIFLLEMSRINFEKLKERVSLYDEYVRTKINCYNVGAWDEEMELSCGEELCNDGMGCSINKGEKGFLNSEEIMTAKCVTIDELLKGKDITLIKMDVEGAEQQALRGAEQIITEKKPKLAICIYHGVSDLWEIPIMIKEMVPEYKIGIRHHSMSTGDTVCYAYID